ncbi:MAG: L-threonylcarbamoyladenylate synthase [Candidatus Saccharimonadaceae bacterium]
MNDDFKRLTEVLANGGIAVVRTDTIYGLIARASKKRAVEKIYEVKRREKSKQCIVLIPGSGTIRAHSALIAKYSSPDQPPTSVVVPKGDEHEWVLRGGKTIAYRVVRDDFLKKVIQAVGPVVAPSANPETLPPARTIEEAKAYFGDEVDIYIDGGEVPEDVQPSRIIEVKPNGTVVTIRP